MQADDPMRKRVTRTIRADEDLLDIWLYIAKDNLDAADALIDNFEAKSKRLAQNPKLGPTRDDIAPGMRMFPVGNYLLLYREVSTGIELVRVVHGARSLMDIL